MANKLFEAFIVFVHSMAWRRPQGAVGRHLGSRLARRRALLTLTSSGRSVAEYGTSRF